MEITQNNISTILVYAFTIIGPYISAYMSQDQFVTIMTAVIGLILAVWSSFKPNNLTILGNNTETTTDEISDDDLVLNEEYEC